jgi:hypothetical protein
VPPADRPLPPALIAAIRTEGLTRSQAMPTATELMDTIGPRLTWSTNYDRAGIWAQRRLAAIGLAAIHREPIDQRGTAWRQDTVWMRMTAPDSMMIPVQASPWSVGSGGDRHADAVLVDVATIADLARYRGALRGKIVLLGKVRTIERGDTPLVQRLTDPAAIDRELGSRRGYFANRRARLGRFADEATFYNALAAFLKSEQPLAIVTPSRSLPSGGDSGLLTVDEPFVPARGQAWNPALRLPIPLFVAVPEQYNRMARLVQGGTPVAVAWHLDVEDGGVQPAHNIVADLPGSDPRIAGETVLVGAHLDSWASGTGAADNGAGVATVIEAMRLLRHAGLRPRRTIRVLLYAGEEQGLLGAQAYAARHLGSRARATTPAQRAVPVESWRLPVGPLVALPDWRRTAAVLNIDDGSGRIRAVFTGGDNPAMAARVAGWLAPLADLGVAHVLDEPNWPADQSVYAALGLPTMSFLQDPLDYNTRAHHTNMDMIERLSADDMAINAVTLATLIAQAANADDPLPRPPLPPVESVMP